MTKIESDHVSPLERTIVQEAFTFFIEGDAKRSASISAITHKHNVREPIMQSLHID
jgi:hypothetical protein